MQTERLSPNDIDRSPASETEDRFTPSMFALRLAHIIILELMHVFSRRNLGRFIDQTVLNNSRHLLS